jgi:hypothetical protein
LEKRELSDLAAFDLTGSLISMSVSIEASGDANTGTRGPFGVGVDGRAVKDILVDGDL